MRLSTQHTHWLSSTTCSQEKKRKTNLISLELFSYTENTYFLNGKYKLLSSFPTYLYIVDPNIRHSRIFSSLTVSKLKHQKSKQSLLKTIRITASFCHLKTFQDPSHFILFIPMSVAEPWPSTRGRNIQQMCRRMEICSSLVSNLF